DRRLVRGGLTLSAAGFTTALSPNSVSAAVPGALLNATLAAALRYGAGQAMTAGLVSAQVAALAEGALQTMAVTRLTFTMAALLIFLGIGGGASLIAFHARDWEQPKTMGISAGSGAKAQAASKHRRGSGAPVVAVADRPRRQPKGAANACLVESPAVRVNGASFQAVVQKKVAVPALSSAQDPWQ